MILNTKGGLQLHLTAKQPPSRCLLPLNTFVISDMEGRSEGIIIGYNNDRAMFFGGDQYPYIILWADGSIEVYSQHSFEVAP
jgi:hypothetical protein